MSNVSELQLPVARTVREIRLQASVVRALLDELDTTSPGLRMMARDQLVEELARLGWRLLEAASSLSNDPAP
jgi:hypothetical protein